MLFTTNNIMLITVTRATRQLIRYWLYTVWCWAGQHSATMGRSRKQVANGVQTFVVLNARVVRAGLRSEAETQNVAIVWTVSDQERAVSQTRQTSVGLVETQRAPVPFTLYASSSSSSSSSHHHHHHHVTITVDVKKRSRKKNEKR